MGHCIDLNTPREETMQAMEQLVREGKITYISSCNTDYTVLCLNVDFFATTHKNL
jgi:aryl-alcohol dehydrogenase-like predicted oxidoreductase